MKHDTTIRTGHFFLSLSILLVAPSSGCGDDDPQNDESTLDIVGLYDDEYGQVHSIGDAAWTLSATDYSSSYDYVLIDNDASFIVAQNSADNDYSAGLFSRLDWLFDAEGSLYYCQCVYDAQSPDSALACESDRDDLSMGCADFAWSLLTPQ
jgi:hypothetical protein